MPLSMTYLAEYMAKSGTQRLTIARKIIQRETNEYEFAADYYGPLRAGIQKFHRDGESRKKLLDRIVERAIPARARNYAAVIDGYKKFLGKKKVANFKPKRVTVSVGGLEILVNPELGLKWNGEKRAIKIIFNKDIKLTKSAASLMLALMRDQLGKDVIPCILDIKAGRLYEGREDFEGIADLVEAEAMSLNALLKKTRK